jgi:hypothetical protein
MKLFAAFPIVLAQAGSYATMVLGNVRELCYRDLQDSCAAYHINGSYADAYNRLYLSDALMIEDPVVTTAAQDLNMKLEKWMPFVDDLSRAQVGLELHNMQQDILPALVNATASQPEPQRDQATSKEMRENAICTAEIAACADGLAAVEMGVEIIAAGAACIAALPTGCEMTDGRLGERLIEAFTPTQ